jgi:hypothetical protein
VKPNAAHALFWLPSLMNTVFSYRDGFSCNTERVNAVARDALRQTRVTIPRMGDVRRPALMFLRFSRSHVPDLSSRSIDNFIIHSSETGLTIDFPAVEDRAAGARDVDPDIPIRIVAEQRGASNLSGCWTAACLYVYCRGFLVICRWFCDGNRQWLSGFFACTPSSVCSGRGCV